MDILSLLIEGFVWDEGNRKKSENKHRVSPRECEEVFFNKPILIAQDTMHLRAEQRFLVLGITDNGRELFIVITVRDNRIRVISARDQNKKEKFKFNN